MKNWKRWLLTLVGSFIALSIIIVLLSLLIVDELVNILWFYSVDYGLYYWLRALYKYIVFAGVWLFLFLVFYVNFWIGSRYLGLTAPPSVTQKTSSLVAFKEIYKLFRSGSMKFFGFISFLISLPIALTIFRQWELFLLYVAGPSAGIQDPVYGKDISYYLFSFPIYTLIQRKLSIAFLLVLAGLAFFYWMGNRVLAQQDRSFPRGAKWHLSLIVLIIFLMEIWGLVLQRYGLLYSTYHEPLFFGPGYVQMKFILYLIWGAIVTLAGVAVSMVLFINSRKGLMPLAIFGALFLALLGIRYSGTSAKVIHEYVVRPNELSLLTPYIRNSIDATLTAYKLKDVETKWFNPEPVQGNEVPPSEVENILRNIPVWDGELLNEVYDHLQKFRTYYDFAQVDVNRIRISDRYQQVYLAAREINIDELPAGARTWVNEHLSYTHGYGFVMTPAEQAGEEQLEWFVQGIPAQSILDFRVEQPGVYFGLMDKEIFSIAPNNFGEVHFPSRDENVIEDYQGSGGIPLSSILKKIIFAYYYWDKNILFTRQTREDSKILIFRNIRDRITRLTPFLILDKDPYLAITPERLYWIQDAYTVSNWFPYSKRTSFDDQEINYIRNSVKVVVDAYNGTVEYYVYDEADPIIQAYRRIYPGVFMDASQMPGHLAAQVRYPQDFFNIQMEIYRKYHQTDPSIFYHQEDLWEFAAIEAFEEPQFTWWGQKSYYLTLDLIQGGETEGRKEDFLLLSPFVPRARTNLRSLVVAGGDLWNYGKIVVYSFPKGYLIHGPYQVSAFINQDTEVSAQFTLWSQSGADVRVGKMIILPIGSTITYIQPVYLAAGHTSIPELKRLIMVQNGVVVMERTLQEAYLKLQERLAQRAGMGQVPPSAEGPEQQRARSENAGGPEPPEEVPADSER